MKFWAIQAITLITMILVVQLLPANVLVLIGCAAIGWHSGKLAIWIATDTTPPKT